MRDLLKALVRGFISAPFLMACVLAGICPDLVYTGKPLARISNPPMRQFFLPGYGVCRCASGDSGRSRICREDESRRCGRGRTFGQSLCKGVAMTTATMDVR